MNWQEKHLLRALRHPDTLHKAFEELVKAHQEPLYWHIRKMVALHDDTNDILQNTFIKAWKGLNNFRGESTLSTWLYRIATNETLTFLEQKKQRALTLGNDYQEELLQQLSADPYFDGDQLQLTLQKAILTLPEKQRLIFNMKYFSDMTYEEISQVLNTSVGALKASYHHTSKKIEEQIKATIL